MSSQDPRHTVEPRLIQEADEHRRIREKLEAGEVRRIPILGLPLFHRPVILQAPFGVPVDQLMNAVSAAANDLSAQGWDVCLPPMIVGSSGPLVGSQKTVSVVVWVRCPADSPLVQQKMAPPAGTTKEPRGSIAEAHGVSREAVRV